MTVEQAYEKFIIKINKNAQTDGVHCDRGRFVELYNEAQIKHLEYLLEQRFHDEIRYAEKFLKNDEQLDVETGGPTMQFAPLPPDFFDLSSAKAIASTDYCQNTYIDLYEVKSEDINLVLQDEFNKPSFDYREAPFILSSGDIKAYREGFTYDKILLTYYRYPQQIRLIDEDDPESFFNETYQIEWDDKSNNRIIDLAASRFFLNNDDNKYQAAQIEAKQK